MSERSAASEYIINVRKECAYPEAARMIGTNDNNTFASSLGSHHLSFQVWYECKY